MSADNLLDQWQDDVVARIASTAFFSDLLLVQERLGVTDSEVEVAQSAERETEGKKPGVVIIVLAPGMERKNRIEALVRCTLRVIEIPRINRTTDGSGKTAQRLEQELWDLLHEWNLANRCVTVEHVDRYNDGEGGVGFEMTLLWSAAHSRAPQAVAPTISGTAAAVTIANNEPGAAVYYTTDGSLPYSSNGALYAAPFAVPAGTIVRAAAYVAGKQGSDVPEKRIN